MKTAARLLLIFLALSMSFSCSKDSDNDDNDDDQGQGQLPMIFEVDPLYFRQYDVERPPSTNDFAAVYGFAVFTPQPTASLYTLKFESETRPHLDFEISWENGEPIPGRGAPANVNDIPGYNLGIVGGEYYIVIFSSGCEGPPGGTCHAGSDGMNQIENNLRDIEGTVTVQIDFE